MSNTVIKHGKPTGEELNEAACALDVDLNNINDETIDRAIRWGARRAKDTDMLTITISRKILQDLAIHLNTAADGYDEHGSLYDLAVCRMLVDWIMLGETSSDEDKPMDEQQASKYLGVTEDKLREWRKNKTGPDYEKYITGTETHVIDGMVKLTYTYAYTYWQSDLDDWKKDNNE